MRPGIRNRRDPLKGYTKEEFIRWLGNVLTGRVEQAWLFGSFAKGSLTAHSDIDLMLVQNTDKPFVERGRDFFDLREKFSAIEYLVYTPEEFDSLIQDPSPGFWRDVTQTMQRVL